MHNETLKKGYTRYDLSYGVTKNLGPRIFRALLLDCTALDGGGALCPSLLLLKIIDKPVDEISILFFYFLGNYHRIIIQYISLFQPGQNLEKNHPLDQCFPLSKTLSD